MRWLTLFILAYVMLAIHLGIRAFITWHEAAPNFVLIAAVFVAINAPRNAALLGCFVLGAMQDLFTQQPLGLQAFTLGLLAIVIVRNQTTIYREHPVTHFLVTLLAGLASAAIILLHAWVYGKLHADSHLSPAAGVLLLDALYSALLAPFIIGLLQRRRRWFAFKSGRPSGFNLRGAA